MMGLPSMIAQSVKGRGNLKYLILAPLGSAINAAEGDDYVLVRHRSVPPGRARLYLVEDIVSALRVHPNGGTFRRGV